MKTDLSLYNNEWYKKEIGASGFKQILWYLINVLFFINPLNPFSGIKISLLRLFGAKLGAGVLLKPGINIKYPWKLIIGNHTWIGEKVWIDNLASVTIGDNVCLSQGAMLITGNHSYSKPAFDLMVSPIILQEGVWIGAGSSVCPGVTALTHAVLAAGSVATGDMEAFSIYQGNPAIKIKTRDIQ